MDLREKLLATSIRMHSLYHTALALCSVKRLDELVEALLPRCITAMDVATACLLTRESELHSRGKPLSEPDIAHIRSQEIPADPACRHGVLPSGKTFLVSPIVEEGSTQGLLVVAEKEVSDFNDEDLERMGNLTTITATALGNVYQYEGLLARTAHLEEGIQQQQQEVDRLHREVGGKYRFENVIGRSATIRQVYILMEKAVESGLTVLITGETGTGKDLVAKAIHYNSPRRDQPLKECNCGAIPRDLVASILFGYRKGAFTGAHEDTPGLFEEAAGGTILLDEIGEMPEEAQVYLLRVLQERKIQRIGETKLRSVDVRVIAVTNRDLQAEVSARRFRSDLYYRLNVFPIHLSPLRERKDDIRGLATHFLQQACRQQGKAIPGFDPDVLGLFQEYAWPGNIRELENEIHRAAALAEEGASIQPDYLSRRIAFGDSLVHKTIAEGGSYSAMVDNFRRQLVTRVLVECEGNRHEAARRLQVHRPNLIKLIRRLGIESTRELSLVARR